MPRSVPRGAVVGPAFFPIFISNLEKSTQNSGYLFDGGDEVVGVGLQEDIEAVSAYLRK